MSSSSSPSQSQPQSQSLGGHSRCGRVLGPSLDKIIKNVAWRKHAQLVSSCKSALDRLDSISDDPATSDSTLSPLYGISLQDSHFVLQPLLLALDSASPKVIEPALDCLFNLFSLALIRGHILPNTSDNGNSNDGSSWILRLIQSASKCARPGEDAIELAVLRVLLSAVRSSSVIIPADALLSIVRTCYNIYLGSLSGTHQICAKSVLAQIMLILFKRIEHDSMNVSIPTVSVSDLLEFTDRNLNEGSSVQHTQNFINEVMDSYTHPLSDPNVNVTSSETTENPDDNAVESPKGTAMESPKGTGGVSKLRDDGFLVFKNLCKLSMKFSSQEHSDDQILLRGKILSLELLKVIMDNGGPIWLNNEMFLSAIKQYLCLSLLKNSVLTVMTIFQLLCSIFLILLLKFRSGLKAEVGIFFPMLILRVLENVLQPSFIQKMTVLNLLEKISQDPHIIIDTFVNYDCDVDAPNIFERTVNGLLKTALGPTPGSNTTLSPIQDIQFRLESVKCLVNIIRSMGSWMDQQLRIGKFYLPNSSETENSSEASSNGEEGTFSDFE